jgi:hypothetical protein
MYLITHSLIYTTALIERQERGRASQIRQQNGQKCGRLLLQVPVYISLSGSQITTRNNIMFPLKTRDEIR